MDPSCTCSGAELKRFLRQHFGPESPRERSSMPSESWSRAATREACHRASMGRHFETDEPSLALLIAAPSPHASLLYALVLMHGMRMHRLRVRADRTAPAPGVPVLS